MAESTSASPSKPEYQHFVPQFILRNFAHKYNGPQRSKKGKKKKNKGDTMFRGELVVNNVNLTTEPFVIEETKVKRILGQYDMYQDTALPAAQRRQIETMLGKLENRVSTIFQKITKAFGSGEPHIWITREERNVIRKFLFVLKYRGSGFHRRFDHDSPESYDSDDKELLRKYMAEQGFTRPVDVWFQGLRTIMDLKMEAEDWEKELAENMYLEDAKWFFMHTEMMYMALVTPAEPAGSDEFILTDNSYNIFEGPSTVEVDPFTGKAAETAWTNFHEFAPLSPKLMIVLRSFVLPVPEEDSDPKKREQREEQRRMAGIEHVESSLADLPITKPRNSYSEIVGGRVRLLPGEDGVRRKTDKFCFKFFPIGTAHVNKINYTLLDNAYTCTNIVFASRDSFAETLEWYMTNTDTLAKAAGIPSGEDRRKFLVALATLMKSLGSTKEPVWAENTDRVLSDFDKMKRLQRSLQGCLQGCLLDWFRDAKKELETSPEQPRGNRFAYISLGGTNETFLEDMRHVADMWRRRVDVDVNPQGQPEDIRDQRRVQLIAEYMTYPPRRVLLFVHHVRTMVMKRIDDEYVQRVLNDIQRQQQLVHPEDIIAQALHDKMSQNKLNWIIYRTAMIDIEKAKYPIPDDEFWSTPPPSLELAIRLPMIRKIVFLLPGLLMDCGIPQIQTLAKAKAQETTILRHHDPKTINGLLSTLPFSFIPADQKLELMTRVQVKPLFRESLADSVETSLLSQLEDVFFTTSYPTPPMAAAPPPAPSPGFGARLDEPEPEPEVPQTGGSRGCVVL